MIKLVQFSSSSTEISHRFRAPASVGMGYFGFRLEQLLPGADLIGRTDGELGLQQSLRGYFTQQVSGNLTGSLL